MDMAKVTAFFSPGSEGWRDVVERDDSAVSRALLLVLACGALTGRWPRGPKVIKLSNGETQLVQFQLFCGYQSFGVRAYADLARPKELGRDSEFSHTLSFAELRELGTEKLLEDVSRWVELMMEHRSEDESGVELAPLCPWHQLLEWLITD